jgi:hypothetical protein
VQADALPAVPSTALFAELEEYRRNEPKKIAERDYWRTLARENEELLIIALDGAACAQCGATGTFDRTNRQWACCGANVRSEVSPPATGASESTTNRRQGGD